jgi:hypothetical protein
MTSPTCFVQECPTCGRRLQILVEYLGKRVVCEHCRGRFVASDPSGARGHEVPPSQSLLRRAEELLQTVSRQEGWPKLNRPK